MKHGPLKKIHLRLGEVPLEVECLRDGTLDVDLDTGLVFSVKDGVRTPRKTHLDDDGYVAFNLHRERKKKHGGKTREVVRLANGSRREVHRYRRRRHVFVHRLVKIKALAVAKGGIHWRKYVADLPRGVDVNHIGAKTDNRNDMLTLETERANRSRTEMTDEEWAEQQAAF